MVGGKCETTGKSQYASRHAARVALNKLRVRRSGHKTERSAYNCKFCGKWHLTSMGETTEASNATRLEPARRWKGWRGDEEE